MKQQCFTQSGCKLNRLIAIGVALAVYSNNGMAHEDDPDEPAGHQEKVMSLAGDNNISFGGGLTLVGQRMSGGTDDDSGLTYSVDLAFEGDFGEKGRAFIYLNTSQGSSVDTGAATGPNGDDESGPDESGFSDTRIAEAWYELPIGELAALRIGKIDPTGIYDGNEVANDETTQFLADAFVNNPAIMFPGYAAGANLAITPSEQLTFNLGFFESTDDFEGSLSSSFLVGEAALGYQLAGLDGHVRLTAWNEDTSRSNGLAINIDQAVNDQITLFARWGSQDDDNDSLEFDNAMSLGGQIALGENKVGIGYSVLTSTDVAGPDDETQIEAYYSHAINDNVHLTLDVQSISNPGFDSNNDDLVVYGLRAQIDL